MENTIKKRLARLIAAAVLSVMTNAAYAQDADSVYMGDDLRACQSTLTGYSTLRESSSIVRSNHIYHVVHTQHRDAQTGMVSHTFVIKSLGSGTERAFTTYFNVVDSTAYYVDVTDMRLFGDICYFCGTLVYTEIYPSGDYIKHGIVGRFMPENMLNGMGSIQYHEVKETGGLTRLAISNAPGANVLISAIGNLDRSNTACIVELSPSGGSSWECWLDTLGTPTGVIFSDIMTMRDSVRLLLQYRCGNNYPYGHSEYDNRHQLFMLDCFDLRGCRYNYNSWTGIYYMAHYDMSADGDHFFHYNKAPMRFSHLNDMSNQFGVAFGVDETNVNYGGIRFFPFRHEWGYDSCIYYRTGRMAEIKEVGNLYKSDTVVLLSKDRGHLNGIAAVPRLGTASHDLTWLYSNNHTLNSFTQRFVGNYIDVSGHNGTYELRLFNQKVAGIPQPSCFEKSAQQYTRLPGRKAALLVAKWGFRKGKDVEWRIANSFEPEVTKTTICEKCNN